MKETKKTAKRTKMAAVSMALAAMMAGQTVVVMAGESDSNVLYTFPLTDGIEIEASTMEYQPSGRLVYNFEFKIKFW